MRLYNSSATLPISLVITLLITPSALPQSAGSPQTQPSSGQERLLPSAVEQLLRERPLSSESQITILGNLTVGVRVEGGPLADDAPIEDLVEFWSNRSNDRRSAGLPGPSDPVRERLLDAAERRPWILPRLYDF